MSSENSNPSPSPSPSGAFVTEEGELVKGALFEPRMMPSGQVRFMVIAEFAAADGETLRQRAEQIARSHWPEKNLDGVQMPINRRVDLFELVAYAPAQSPPDILKLFDGKIVRVEDHDEIKPGIRIRVRVELRAYEGFRDQRDGVSARLMAVIKTNDGIGGEDNMTAIARALGVGDDGGNDGGDDEPPF